MPVTLPSNNKKRISVLAQAVVTKYHRLDGLSNRDLFWWSGGWKSKIKALAAAVSGEKRLPGLETVVFSLRPHVVAEVRDSLEPLVRVQVLSTRAMLSLPKHLPKSHTT